MDLPLGRKIGNALEVQEACEVLRGTGEKRISALCLELAANMIYLGRQAESPEEAREKAKQAVSSGAAFEKLCETAEAQGGDSSFLREPEKLSLSPVRKEVRAPETGWITALNAEECGLAAMELGAGRETKESKIDLGAGISLLKTKGDPVTAGEPLALLYSESEEKCRRGEERLLSALRLGPARPKEEPLILERIEAE